MKVLLGVPHNGTCVFNSSKAAWRCSKDHEVEVMDLPSSLLAMSFNAMYAQALDRSEPGGDIELFAMLHADLAPQGFWLDTLVEELLDKQADMVSAVNVIKDDRGLTSTGIGWPGAVWKPFRRFTLTELAEFPETFNASDVGYEGLVLLHNTGCWVADVRKPLFHEEDEAGQARAYFTINDRIVRGKDGKRRVEVEPEDWFFSRRLHELGANTYVTRKVETHHYGLAALSNRDVRGQAEDDEVVDMWANELLEAAHADK